MNNPDKDNPAPTEAEQELQGTERHRQEEDMRGGAQDDDLPVGDEGDGD